MKHFNADYTTTQKILLELQYFVDGDGFLARDFYSKKDYEIRLYGIDAPEIKHCKKLLKDEKELNLSGELLMKLGFLSFEFIRSIADVGQKIILEQESNNLKDKYGRMLGYAYLENGLCINELMIKEGYAKPYNDIFCERLPMYQEWSLQAKVAKRGLYKFVEKF